MERYLQETPLLNYSDVSIQNLINQKGWASHSEFEKIREIYEYIRDDILFGYNVDDEIAASQILKDGYGQCNTKGILFMAILRAVNVPCRIHGFTINKELQKGAMTGFVYKMAPENVVHSWVEIFYHNKWYSLEGLIIDKKYLNSLQKIFIDCNASFCGYGVAVLNFQNPTIDWNENDTYIQKEGINQDFGEYDSPDDFLKAHRQNLSFLKKFLYQNVGRHLMNRNVSKIRNR